MLEYGCRTGPPGYTAKILFHSPAGEGAGEFEFGRLEKKPGPLSILCGVRSTRVSKITTENSTGFNYTFIVSLEGNDKCKRTTADMANRVQLFSTT